MLARLLLFPVLLTLVSARAQDLHFSQSYLHPLQLNPASTGIFQGDWRVAGIYRSQWSNVPVDYRTFGAAFDLKAGQRGGTRFSAGLLLERDQAGDAGLSWTQAGLTGSATRSLSDRQSLTAGIGVAFVQRAFELAKLKFKNQWTGDVYDASLPTGESFGRSSGFVPTFSAGLLWNYQTTGTRSGLQLGIGAAHLNRPAVSFRDDARATLPMRFHVLAQGNRQLNTHTDLVVFGSVQQMTKTREIVAGAGLRRLLITGPANATALQFSLSTRLNDAFIPAIQIERNGWTVGLSYDWNISDFQVATSHHGGLEIAAVYRWLRVPPLDILKACPIF